MRAKPFVDGYVKRRWSTSAAFERWSLVPVNGFTCSLRVIWSSLSWFQMYFAICGIHAVPLAQSGVFIRPKCGKAGDESPAFPAV